MRESTVARVGIVGNGFVAGALAARLAGDPALGLEVAFVAAADYLPLSTTALVDDALRGELEAVALASGTRLVLPHGAVVGGDSLLEWRAEWAEVTITFRKHPRAIDFAASGIDPAEVVGPFQVATGRLGIPTLA